MNPPDSLVAALQNIKRAHRQSKSASEESIEACGRTADAFGDCDWSFLGGSAIFVITNS